MDDETRKKMNVEETFAAIDKIIGKLYPLFGICLIIMAIGIAGWKRETDPWKKLLRTMKKV